MTNRDNLLRALRRQSPEWVPFHFQLCPSQQKVFLEKTGATDFVPYFDLPIRFVELPAVKKKHDYSMYHQHLPQNAHIDEWGVGQEPGSVAHFTRMHHPMAHFETPDEVWSYPYPDHLDDILWMDVHAQVESAHREGRAAGFWTIQIFEYAWYLRGLENLLLDMMANEDMAQACLDKMVQFQALIAAKAAQSGVDIILFGDDVGSQKGMIMNPALWRKWLKPALHHVIKAAKDVNPDVLAFYHSDGVVYDIIPDLIDIGVDILNPIQPECMDPAVVKQQYGDRLSFWGTIGTQTVMPFGTPEDVKANVIDRIHTVGKGGGLLLAPTHLLEPEVPWENIIAFVDACKEYGRY